MSVPASIRNKNPGAMYPGRASRAFNAVGQETIGGGHKIATFAEHVDGGAALFYLLSTSKHYKNKTIEQAITTWSGGNYVESYLFQIEGKTPHNRNTVLDETFLSDPASMIPLAKAMAFHEAGKPYPMTDDEWQEAFSLSRQKITPGGGYSPTEPVLGPMNYAKQYVGEQEIKGPQDNPFINGCFAEIGLPQFDDDDPWCTAFLGASLKRSGCAYNHKRGDARSYLDYGIKIDEPEMGAIVIMWRESPNSWKGHVGFVTGWTDTHVTILGGNQNDSVSYMTVPRRGSQSQILGYRRAIPMKPPVSEVIGSDDVKYKAAGFVATLSAMFWAMWEGFAEAAAIGYAYLVSLFSASPEIATEVTEQINSSQRISELLDLPWPIYLSLFIVALAIIGNFSKTWKRMRNREDPATRVDARAG